MLALSNGPKLLSSQAGGFIIRRYCGEPAATAPLPCVGHSAERSLMYAELMSVCPRGPGGHAESAGAGDPPPRAPRSEGAGNSDVQPPVGAAETDVSSSDVRFITNMFCYSYCDCSINSVRVEYV